MKTFCLKFQFCSYGRHVTLGYSLHLSLSFLIYAMCSGHRVLLCRGLNKILSRCPQCAWHRVGSARCLLSPPPPSFRQKNNQHQDQTLLPLPASITLMSRGPSFCLTDPSYYNPSLQPPVLWSMGKSESCQHGPHRRLFQI